MYLDLLVGSSVAYIIGTFLDIDRYHWPLAFGFWVALELLVQKPFGQSFGRYAMGIVQTPEGERTDAELAERQSGWFLALGIVTVLSSSKMVARGFSDYTFFYLADNKFTGLDGRILWVLLAAASVWSAAALFRLHSYAPYALMAVTLFVPVNDAMSPDALVEHAAEYKSAREAMRGKPSPITPEALANVRLVGGAIWAVILALSLFAARHRFRPRAESTDAFASSNVG